MPGIYAVRRLLKKATDRTPVRVLKRGQTALSTAAGFVAFVRVRDGDRVVSPLFATALSTAAGLVAFVGLRNGDRVVSPLLAQKTASSTGAPAPQPSRPAAEAWFAATSR